ncbi:hypothetical protein [Megalodesulfovibrio paquesii]
MPHRNRPLSLFAPSLDVDPSIKAAMRRAYESSGLSMEQVVDWMNEAAGEHGITLSAGRGGRLSVETLAKWLNPTETDRPVPARGLVAFCRALHTLEPLQALVAPLEARVIDRKQVALLQLAELEETERQLKKKKARLRAVLED